VTSAVLSRVPPESVAEDARQRLLSIPAELDKTIVERSMVTLDLTTAWVAGEHCALLGPPGTAKSKLVRAIMKIFNALTTQPDGSFDGVLNYFEYLLTPFTEPNELFGPIDIVAYKAGNYRRMTSRMLPEAHIAFLDEAFKANSAILNALLTMLNERIFHEGGFVKETPLRMVVMASNELPAQGLSALWDRCLVRHVIEPISRPENEAALFAGTLPVAAGQPLASLADADAVAGLASVVTLPDEVLAAMSKLHSDLKAKGLSVTDRRKDQEGRWLQVCAALDGKTAVELEHIARLAPLLWSRYEDRPIVDLAIEPYAAAYRVQLKLVQAALKKLDAEIPQDLSKCSLDQLGRWAKEIASLNKSLAGYRGKPGVDVTVGDLSNRGGVLKTRLVQLKGPAQGVER